MTSFASLPSAVIELIVAQGQLRLVDVHTLLLVSKSFNTTFTTRRFYVFLLEHFFPFASETQSFLPSAAVLAVAARNQPFPYETSPIETNPRLALNTLCRRLHRLRNRDWSSVWEFSFSEYDQSQNLDKTRDFWFSDGFFLIDVAGGDLLTAATDVEKGEIVMNVGNLDGRRMVQVVVPMDPFNVTGKHRHLHNTSNFGVTERSRNGVEKESEKKWSQLKRPGIYLRYGKVLVVYDHPGHQETQFLLMDANFDGRRLWTAVLNTKVFLGIDQPSVRISESGTQNEIDPRSISLSHFHYKRLQPEFNEHYVVFLDTYPGGTITVCRFVSTDPAIPLDCFATEIIASPTFLSYQPDGLGRLLAVANKLQDGSHHITIVDVCGSSLDPGCKLQDLDLQKSFTNGKMDLEYHLSADNSKLIIYASAFDSNLTQYNHLILGQLSVYDVRRNNSTKDKGAAKIRYFLNSNQGLFSSSGLNSSFDLDLCALTCCNSLEFSTTSVFAKPFFLWYESLNLDVTFAESGITANDYNTLQPFWISSTQPSQTKDFTTEHVTISSSKSSTTEHHLHTIFSKHWICVLSAPQKNPHTKIMRLYSIGESPNTDFSVSNTPSRAQTPSDFFVHHSQALSSSGSLSIPSYSRNRSASPMPRSYSPNTREVWNAKAEIGELQLQRHNVVEKSLAQDQAMVHAKLLAAALEKERWRRERERGGLLRGFRIGRKNSDELMQVEDVYGGYDGGVCGGSGGGGKESGGVDMGKEKEREKIRKWRKLLKFGH